MAFYLKSASGTLPYFGDVEVGKYTRLRRRPKKLVINIFGRDIDGDGSGVGRRIYRLEVAVDGNAAIARLNVQFHPLGDCEL